MRSLQRKAIGLALFGTFAACTSVEVIHLDSSAFLDLRDEPVVDQTLKEFQEATGRTPDYLLEACPSSCTELKSESEWFLYSDAARLNLCNETLLMEFALEHDLKDNNDKTAIKACKADYGIVKEVGQSLETAAVCPTPNHAQVNTSVKITSHGSSDLAATGALAALTQINNYVSSQPRSCDNNTISFGYSSGAVAGLYSGKEIHHQGVTAQLLRKFEEYLQKGSVSQGVIVQLCNNGGRGADYAIGIAASLSGDLSFVQTATKAWKDGKCMPGGEEGATLTQLRFNVPDTNTGSSKIVNSTESTRRSIDNTIFRSRLTARADCKTTKVAAGDGCFAVAARCGISQADLTKYNPRTNFCTTLAVDETVCCSSGTLPDTTLPPNTDGTCQTRRIVSGDSCSTLAAKCGITPAQFTTLNPSTTLCSTLAPGGIVCCGRGKLPDITPKPNSDGSCFVYQTKKDDSCSVIAASRGLTVAKVEEFNKNTWGWNGCELLWVGVNMCLSTGTPPMPAPVSNAVCGPTVPGTQKPASFTNLAGLNPCPLKVCCNIWGQCGTTADFCVISKSASGAPGTAAPGSNGCIANCGMDIVSSGPPATKVKVAYFESWNWERPCLHMHVDSINTATYTHIHFAFGNITSNFQVDVSGAQDEFDRFKKMTGIKKIISFGGWAFSTEPGTFKILREATKAANRNTFVTNLANFVTSNGLDGIDLDWEYPGAPDIPEIPSGDAVEGMDYYNTLVQLKSKLGSGKSVSFAAPASYWYLKAFPIELMGAALDYIIYMTYDLHGQWDYGNKWTSPGCPTGNCLRSHVNLTETTNALSMITKAGVPSNKVVVGVASYGRSFKMAQAGCTGPACLFTGSARVSNAAKGECTQTGGYISNAEIQEIIGAGGVQQYVVEDSDILVYGGGTEWMSYMKDTTKAGRETLYAKYNFAGTTDWAVDLQAYTADEEYVEEDDPLYGTYEEHVSDSEASQCSSKYRSLDQLEKDADKIPSDCMATYIVAAEAAILGDALDSYDTLIKGKYDKKFEVYQRAMIEQIPLQIYQYMAGAQTSGFFQCTETKIQCCRSKCTSGLGCSADCSTAAGCQTGKVTVKVDCPTTLAYPYVATYTAQPNITYTCTNMDGFYKDISEKYGIDRSWLTWSDRRVQVQTGCSGSGKKAEDCLKLTSHYWYNYPAPASNIQIPNPKSVIGGRYNEMRALKMRMESQSTNADIFSVSRIDIADSGSLPALMMQFAITNMNQVIETANKILEQERKSMILNFVTAFLMFIPLAGGAAGSIGGGLLRTIINIGGELGNLAVGIYSVVDEPGNALVTIFGMLLGGVNVRPFKEIATYRRNIKSEDLNQLGPIKKDLDRIDTLKAKGNSPSCGIR